MWSGLMPFLGVFRCRYFSRIARNAISYAFCLLNNHHIVYFPFGTLDSPSQCRT